MSPELCANCAVLLDRVRVGAHGLRFCSMQCADAWEKNPKNGPALRESHRLAAAMGWPHDRSKLG